MAAKTCKSLFWLCWNLDLRCDDVNSGNLNNPGSAYLHALVRVCTLVLVMTTTDPNRTFHCQAVTGDQPKTTNLCRGQRVGKLLSSLPHSSCMITRKRLRHSERVFFPRNHSTKSDQFPQKSCFQILLFTFFNFKLILTQFLEYYLSIFLNNCDWRVLKIKAKILN